MFFLPLPSRTSLEGFFDSDVLTPPFPLHVSHSGRDARLHVRYGTYYFLFPLVSSRHRSFEVFLPAYIPHPPNPSLVLSCIVDGSPVVSSPDINVLSLDAFMYNVFISFS